jgi:hypothetical protein
MGIVPDFTNRTITLVGGLLATGAAVIAETLSTDTTVGTGSFLLGGAGLIAAISAFTKDYWSDRQKQRDHELSMLRIKLRSSRNSDAIHQLYNWARAAHGAMPSLPAVPECRLEDDLQAETENRET